MEAEPNSVRLLAFFKALSDENRLRMVGLLMERPYSGEELALRLGLSPATVSHHLKRLAEVGLVSAAAEQYYHVYSLDRQALREMANRILDGQALAEAAPIDGDGYERKVLRDFLVEGRLKTIPRQRRKRDVILRHILNSFEAGRRYSEGEVNEVLVRFHEDVATLRREMIASRLMARERQGYTRI